MNQFIEKANETNNLEYLNKKFNVFMLLSRMPNSLRALLAL